MPILQQRLCSSWPLIKPFKTSCFSPRLWTYPLIRITAAMRIRRLGSSWGDHILVHWQLGLSQCLPVLSGHIMHPVLQLRLLITMWVSEPYCVHLTDQKKWQYFEPIRQGMPKNCSKDINLVIEYMDKVFTLGNASEQLALKKKFGLEYLQHGNDVMGQVLFWVAVINLD